MAVVCENYPESQVSKENFTDIQRSAGLWMSSLKRGSPLRCLIPIGLITACYDELTKDLLAAMVPTLVAWAGSRL